MLTLSDAQDDKGLKRISTYCPTSDDFIDLVNTACRRLLRRGDWAGTLQPIYLCVRGGCVVWPRYALTVRALGWCGHQVTPENVWGSFLPRGANEVWRQGMQWHNCENRNSIIQQGRTSVFQDIQGDGRLVRAYVRCNSDVGRTVSIYGTDNNGQPLQTQNPDKSWVMGQTLTLAKPWVSTNNFVRHIDYVLKDATDCPINLFAYNANTNLLEDIAQYEPDETRPSYERTRINIPCGLIGSCGNNGSRGVAALVKLKFIAAKNPNDLLIPDNIDAIKLEIQSIKAGEAGNRNEAKAFELDAIEILQRQLEDESPDDQFVADNQVLGGATFSNHAF